MDKHCNHCHCESDSGCEVKKTDWKHFLPEATSLVLLIICVCIQWHSPVAELVAFIIAVLPVGLPIFLQTLREWSKGDLFNEFTLMMLACVGAFFLGEYAEAVAVLLFYGIGEKIEDVVSGDVKGQIKQLLGKMPKEAVVLEAGERHILKPEEVKAGQIIAIAVGESLPLDGVLLNEEEVEFNTSAITGESLPRIFVKGDSITSGMIPVNREARVQVTSEWNDSSMARMMRMIEESAQHRAPSEKVLRRITRWYTPIVFAAAVLLVFIPWIVGLCNPAFHFSWMEWFKRSLVFLVCSCPCALIVSIPLTYFTSIGLASKKGILFKGHDSLDAIRKIDTMLLDKTGTVTTGQFRISDIKAFGKENVDETLSTTASIEAGSRHPLAVAIVSEAKRRGLKPVPIEDAITIDHGMEAVSDGKKVLVGSRKLMDKNSIKFPDNQQSGTAVYVAIDSQPAAIIEFRDTIKDGAVEAVESLRKRRVETIGILSGDAPEAVQYAADAIGANLYRGELLPVDKSEFIGKLKDGRHVVGFTGDGINDSIALTAADVGIAMGSMGSDMAIETAQVVIAGDDLRKISEGIDISRRVRNVIIENVSFAFGIKLLVMILGAFGIATLWAAVFADTGVTFVTILWTLSRLKVWQLKTKKTA